VAEIGVLRAGRQNERIIGNAAAFGDHLAPRGVDAGHLTQHHVDVLLAAQNAADRRGDFGRRKSGGCDLIEQRLEQVIVVLVDHRDVEWLAVQCFRRGETTESGSDDDDARGSCHDFACWNREFVRCHTQYGVSSVSPHPAHAGSWIEISYDHRLDSVGVSICYITRRNGWG
jgi:hypothetical protein